MAASVDTVRLLHRQCTHRSSKRFNRVDKVSDGNLEWKSLLDDFYKDFDKKVEAAGGEDGMRSNEPSKTDIKCKKCNRDMQIRTASTGVFMGCSGYALTPKERCKNTINLISGDEVQGPKPKFLSKRSQATPSSKVTERS